MQSIPNAQFISSHVIDSKGHFMGECGGVGAAAVQDVDNDGDLIPDACDPCPTVPDEQYRTTGVYSDLGPDFDGDGVPDICDDCPMTANPPVVFGTHLLQRDADTDGMGDACDSCNSDFAFNSTRPKLRYADLRQCNTGADCPGTFLVTDASGGSFYTNNRCITRDPGTVPSPLGWSSTLLFPACAIPPDHDSDLVPDSCDNCPETNNDDQVDADADGIGDACDNCPGTSEFGAQEADKGRTAACSFDPLDLTAGDASCRAAVSTLTGSDTRLQCVPAHRFTLPDGRALETTPQCALQNDADGDGLGASCDGCPNVKKARDWENNCNVEAEIANDVPYPYVPDECDRVPCPQMANWADSSFAYRPTLVPKGSTVAPGPFTGTIAYDYSGTPLATVGGRFCSCKVPTGTSTDPLAGVGTPQKCALAPPAGGSCVLRGARGEYDKAGIGSQWLTVALSPPPPPAPVVPGVTQTHPWEFAGIPMQVPLGVAATTDLNAFASFDVDWDQDALTALGVPAEAVRRDGTSATGFIRFGEYWAHIPSVSGLVADPNQYRDYSNTYRAAYFGTLPPSNPNGIGAIKIPCDGTAPSGAVPGCDPGGLIGDGCMTRWFTTPAQPAQPFGIYLVSSKTIHNATQLLTPRLAASLGDSGLRWVASSEQGMLLPGRALAAALSEDATHVMATLRRDDSTFDVTLPFQQVSLGTSGFALFASTTLSVNDRVRTVEPSGTPAPVGVGSGEANIGADAKVGPVWSGGSVLLRERAEVVGSLRTVGALTTQSGTLIRGATVHNAQIALPDLSAFAVPFPAVGNPVSVEPNVTQPLTPDSYGPISVKTGATLALGSGRYFTTSLTLEPGSQVRFDTTGGPVYLYVSDAFIYRGKFVDTGGRHDRVFVGYFGTSMAIVDSPFDGTLVAPNGKIDVATVGSPGHTGQFAAKQIEVHEGSLVTHVPFAFPWGFSADNVEPEGSLFKSSPSARSNFGATLSMKHNALFVVGGVLRGSSALTADIWRFSLGGNSDVRPTWRRLPVTGVTPQRVLAATYRPVDDSIYWIDQTDSSTARLVRYGVSSGVSSTLGTWPIRSTTDSVFISNAPDDRLLVATSSGTLNSNCMSVLQPTQSGFTEVWGMTGIGSFLGDVGLNVNGLSSIYPDPGGTLGARATCTPFSDLPITHTQPVAGCF